MKSIITFLAWALLSTIASAQQNPLFDEQLFTNAPVVLRVKWMNDTGADKYAWQDVEILQILKNESSHSFSNTLSIAHDSWEEGIPHATCTVYLERYDRKKDDLWKLKNGNAKQGVSHTKGK